MVTSFLCTLSNFWFPCNYLFSLMDVLELYNLTCMTVSCVKLPCCCCILSLGCVQHGRPTAVRAICRCERRPWNDGKLTKNTTAISGLDTWRWMRINSTAQVSEGANEALQSVSSFCFSCWPSQTSLYAKQRLHFSISVSTWEIIIFFIA